MIEIRENFEIKNKTSFRIGGTVKKVAFQSSSSELIDLLQSGEYDMVLGNCSNVLFSSGYTNKNIIITAQMKSWEIKGSEVSVECGVTGPFAASVCQKKALSGFEFMAGFPGSFGGMICMNASAHNMCISDTFLSARVYDGRDKTVKTFDKSAMKFSYRNSVISSGDYVVIDAKFMLTPGNSDEISDITQRNIKFRKEHQPSLAYGNAGSIFKNPDNDSAGRLLDMCGLKGCKLGGAQVYEKHANFIVNADNASSSDVIELMYKMYNAVKDKYGIELHPEIKYIGSHDTKEYELWKEMSTENTPSIQK